MTKRVRLGGLVVGLVLGVSLTVYLLGMAPPGPPGPGTPTPPGGVVTITFAAWDEERAIYTPLIAAFEAAHPTIRVRFVALDQVVEPIPLPHGEAGTMMVQDPARALPGVVRAVDTAAVEASAQALAQGYLRDLAPLIAADPTFDLTDFYNGTLAIFSRSGPLYMLPSYLRVGLLQYDRSQWTAQGLAAPAADWTWTDLVAAATRLAQAPGGDAAHYGLVGGGTGTDVLFSALTAAGIDLDPGHDQRLDDPAIVAVVDQVAALGQAHTVYLPGRGTDSDGRGDPARQLVLAGQAGLWALDLMGGRADQLSTTRAVLPYPAAPLGAEGYIMSNGTQHPDEAWQWLHFLSRHAIGWAHGGSAPLDRVPVRRSVADVTGYWGGLDGDLRPAIEAVLQHAAEGTLVHLNWLTFSPDALGQALADVVTRRKATADALYDAQTTLDPFVLAPARAFVVAPPPPEGGPDATAGTDQGGALPEPAPSGPPATPHAFVSSTPAPPLVSAADLDAMAIDPFFETVFRDLTLRDPEQTTTLGLPADYAPGFPLDTLTDLSDGYTRETLARAQRYLDRLRRYDRSALSEDQVLSAQILDWYLDDLVHGQEFTYDPYPVNPLFGVQNTILDFMTNIHPLRDQAAAAAYVARLNAFPDKFAGLRDGLQRRETQGIVPPKSLIRSVLEQMRAFTALPVADNALYTSFQARLAPLTTLTPADKTALAAQVAGAITTSVYPAYNDLIAYFTHLEPLGRDTDGIWALPNGDATYRAMLRHQLTLDLTPEEVHQTGLREVARIQAELRAALQAQGYPSTDLRAGIARVVAASGTHPMDTPAQRAQLLADYRAIITETAGRLGSLFDLQPRAPVEVRAVPPYREAGAPLANYVPPTLDGTRPGGIYINLGRPVPNYLMPSLTYHEAIPGHHFELGLQAELTGVPTFRRAWIASGPAEGWAVYSERLAGEAGFYAGDPLGNLGRLQNDLGRALRVVVDTGIHYKRWTRQQALEYMRQNGVASEPAIISEVDRYIAWPGQAATYKIGQLKILELRERARLALGDRFNIKEFHQVVLQNGSMPLTILEQVVDGYIAAHQTGTP